jgi:hypothetical protein
MSCFFQKATREKILNHAAVAMQQNQRLAVSPLDIMKTHTVYFDEFSPRRVIAFSSFRNEAIYDCGDCERSSHSCHANRDRVWRDTRPRIPLGGQWGTKRREKH